MMTFLRNATLAAAMTLSMGVAAHAATLNNLNTGVNSIVVDEVYFYQETLAASGADSRTFTLQSLIPLKLEGAVVTLTLRSVNAIRGLSVALTDLMGSTVLTPVSSTSTSVTYEFSTLFNSLNGLSQDLVIGWDAVTGRGAQFNVQIATSAVPVPAGGLMLVGAIAGLAALRRRKAV
jgi:hypothetical protein